MWTIPQIFMRICSHLLEINLTENFILCSDQFAFTKFTDLKLATNFLIIYLC